VIADFRAAMSDVTQILNAIESGDAKAADQLLPLVYEELRKLAAAQMAREKPGHTLDATALVHEAYIRLVANDGRASSQQDGRASSQQDGRASSREADVDAAHTSGSRLDARRQFANRRHFFAAAAEAMRRILVESARRKHTEKRGGDRKRSDFDPEQLAAPQLDDDLLALDEALELLAKSEPPIAELVKLRHFTGLTIPQAAEILDISSRTADAWWAYARAFLLAKVRGEG
jgi:RNA polymerase sigma factor (TIGR02999 family)